ncbi:hypothetical protein LCGC14_2239780 [marine sediment metagenome]|uniref:Uncharacterized protein n=1 Tax=marine sediment metagenome TaxID=412755 RepID=A0A0F9D5Z7_9ZZZZ
MKVYYEGKWTKVKNWKNVHHLPIRKRNWWKKLLKRGGK